VRASLVSRPAGGLLGAAACAVVMALSWAATFHIGALTRLDGHAMEGFAELHDSLGDISGPIVHAFGPLQLAIACVCLVGVALVQRRPRLAAAAVLVLIGANASAQVLERVLASPRGFDIEPESWPSGHATAAMSLALCLVLVVPLRWRPAAGAAAAVFALVVGVAILITGGHFLSDVLGGFVLAAFWMAIAVAAMQGLPARRSAQERAARQGAREVLKPTRIALAILAGLTAVGLVARAGAVIDHVEKHPAVVVGALALAVAAIALAAAVSLVLTLHEPENR
jgi:membrane-associated phospholipid phosphatase